MAVDKTNIFSSAWSALKSHIFSNVSDPKNRFKKTWIFSDRQYPSATGATQYPYIVIYPFDVRQRDPVNDNSMHKTNLVVEIEILTQDAESNDTLSGSIFGALNSETNRETLYGEGLKMGLITTSPTTTEFVEGEKVIVRSMAIMFERLI